MIRPNKWVRFSMVLVKMQSEAVTAIKCKTHQNLLNVGLCFLAWAQLSFLSSPGPFDPSCSIVSYRRFHVSLCWSHRASGGGRWYSVVSSRLLGGHKLRGVPSSP